MASEDLESIVEDGADAPRQRWRRMLAFVAAYVAWLVVSGAAGVILFFIWLPALLRVYTALALQIRSRQAIWAYAAFNNAVAITFALIWIVLVILGEAWLRSAAERGLLPRRILLIVLSEAIAGALGYLVVRFA